MRKILALLLALALCLSLCACKSDAVANVEALIEAIGTVTPDSEAAIAAAEKAFAELPEEEWGRVENYETLMIARNAYNSLYKTVAITSENWDTYFELVTEPIWRENAAGEATQLREIRIFRLKEEYVSKVKGELTRLELHFEIPGEVRLSTVDWAARTFTEGTVLPKETLRTGTASYAWPGTATTDLEQAAMLTEIHVGYSHLSNPKTDAADTKLFVFTHNLTAIDGQITVLVN